MLLSLLSGLYRVHGLHVSSLCPVTRMLILLVECGLVHMGDCIERHVFFCFDPAFVWPSLANPFRVFVRVPDLAGDARQWWQLGLCLCSLIEQTDAARSALNS